MSRPSHPPDLITLIIFEVNKLWSSSLCIVLQPPATSSLLCPNVLLRTFFSDTHSMWHTHTHKTTGSLAVLHILIASFILQKTRIKACRMTVLYDLWMQSVKNDTSCKRYHVKVEWRTKKTRHLSIYMDHVVPHFMAQTASGLRRTGTTHWVEEKKNAYRILGRSLWSFGCIWYVVTKMSFWECETDWTGSELCTEVGNG
jgi:hypothetical protein